MEVTFKCTGSEKERDEEFKRGLEKFKKMVQKSGVLSECLDNRYFRSKREWKKIKALRRKKNKGNRNG